MLRGHRRPQVHPQADRHIFGWGTKGNKREYHVTKIANERWKWTKTEKWKLERAKESSVRQQMLKNVPNSLLTVQASPRIFINQSSKSSPGKFFTVSLKSVECLTAEREVAGSVLRVLKYIDTQMKCIFFFFKKSFYPKTLNRFQLFSLASPLRPAATRRRWQASTSRTWSIVRQGPFSRKSR